jgi:hypothetical protein
MKLTEELTLIRGLKMWEKIKTLLRLKKKQADEDPEEAKAVTAYSNYRIEIKYNSKEAEVYDVYDYRVDSEYVLLALKNDKDSFMYRYFDPDDIDSINITGFI